MTNPINYTYQNTKSKNPQHARLFTYIDMIFYRRLINSLFIIIFAFTSSSCTDKKSQHPSINPHEVNGPSEATETSNSSPNLIKKEESAQLGKPIPVQSANSPQKPAPVASTDGTASLMPIQQQSAQLGNPIPTQSMPLLQKTAPVSNTHGIAPVLPISEEPTQPDKQRESFSMFKLLSSVFKTDTASQTIRKPKNNTPSSYSSFTRRNSKTMTKQSPNRNKKCFPTTNNSSLHRELNRRFAGGENEDS